MSLVNSLGSGLIKGRWKIIRKIGQGAFGEIYQGRNIVTNEEVAIKVERVDSKKQVLKLEVAVLKKLQVLATPANPYVVSFLTCGRHGDYNYMVMELLGENISELRRRQANGRFSLLTTMKMAIQMTRGIEAVHDLGYLHRDVKPSNFAMGLNPPSKRKQVFLIDFGLARRYLLPTGEVRPPRESTGFRGTARYASINSHLSKDLSRRDDLWSLLYMLIEFAQGQLPWRRIRDKDQVGEMKMRYNTPELVADLPPEFLAFMEHLQGLKYEDRPNYSYIISLFENLFRRIGGDDATPFDWERVPSRNKQRPRPLPTLVDLAFLQVVTNLERYPDLRVPHQLKKRMLDFWIRVHGGAIQLPMLERLLDAEVPSLDLAACQFDDTLFACVAKRCQALKSLTLGPVTDAILKDLLPSTQSLDRLSFVCTKGLTNKGVKLIGESCKNLTSLKVRHSEKVNDKAIEFVLRQCPHLVELDLVGCKKFKGVAFRPWAKSASKRPLALRRLNLSYCELTKGGFKQLVRISYELEALYFSPLTTSFKITSADFLHLIHRAKKLITLDLSNYHFEMDTILIEVSKCCINVSTLLLDGIGMTDFGLQNVVQNCSKLETLGFRYGDGVSDASLHQIAKSCPGLKSLTLDFWNKFNRLSVSDHAIRNLLSACTLLRELSLCNCLILTGQCFPENGYFPYLHSLNLSECIQLNDFAIKRITESCPSLKKLHLNNLNNLTEVSLRSIASGCPLLDELYLKQCCCFTDQEVFGLLQSMPNLFVTVTRFPDSDLRGVEVEVHSSTVQRVFGEEVLNTYRVKAFDKTRKRMFGLDS